MHAILTIGISASGKTTWASEFIAQQYLEHGIVWVNVNRDDLRAAIMRESGLEPVWKNWKWKWEDRVTARVEALIQLAAANRHNIVVSDTNLSKPRRDAMIAKLESLGYAVELEHFNVSYDEAVARDKLRANGVGYDVIQKQWQQYLDEFGVRAVQNPNMPKVVICDIDGTVALMEGHRGPFEWDKVHLDRPNQPVIEMVRGLAAAGHLIVFTSGRDGSCRELTVGWIRKHIGLPNGSWILLMRNPGDQRKDTVVKREIFDQNIRDAYCVVVVLDDRPSVCRMWRDLGLNVVQVGNPYIEF